MTVKNEIKGETYKKLIEYAINNCAEFSLVYRYDQNLEYNTHMKNKLKEYQAAGINIDEIENIQEKSSIKEALLIDKYNEIHQKTLKKLKKYKLHEKYETMFSSIKNKEIPYASTYYYKKNKELLNFFLEKNSIYEWVFENSLEDLSFYIGGSPFIQTVAHEHLCWIECRNKEEYEYLKSIGIKFLEKEFEPSIYF